MILIIQDMLLMDALPTAQYYIKTCLHSQHMYIDSATHSFHLRRDDEIFCTLFVCCRSSTGEKDCFRISYDWNERQNIKEPENLEFNDISRIQLCYWNEKHSANTHELSTWIC